MGEASVHPTLSIAWLRKEPRCDWFILSKIKRGPGVVLACHFCHRASKKPECVMHQGKTSCPQ